MTTLTAPAPPPATASRPRTVAELIERLGVPAERILLDPPPGTATEADLLRVNASGRRTCELVDGVLVEKPVGAWEGWLAGRLHTLIDVFLMNGHDWGRAFMGDNFFRTTAGRSRAPDVWYTTHERLAESQRRRAKVILVASDLAVEVVSASNRTGELAGKRREYFAGGTRMVWEIHPVSRTAQIYADPASPDAFTLLGPDGTLDGAGVLPGFTATLRELFASLPADAFDPPLED